MKHPTVVADAFANSAGEHVVRPRPRASFQVGCDIRGNQPGNTLVCVHVSRTLLANARRSAGLGPVAIGVTTKAIERTTDEVGSTRSARWRDIEFDVPQGTRTRSDND